MTVEPVNAAVETIPAAVQPTTSEPLPLCCDRRSPARSAGPLPSAGTRYVAVIGLW